MQQALIYPGLDGRAVTMINLPTFNTAGINEQSIPTFLVGGTIGILPSGGWTPRAMGEAIDRWSVTMATILPSMMQPFLDADAEREIGLATLRVVATGGENCPPAVMARFQERWPQAVLYQGYGSTESGIVTEIAGEEWRKHPGSVGRAAVGMTFRIQGPDRELVGSGEVGEIWAAGGSIVPGYWNAPELNASVLDHGWLNTGDLGWQDEDGYLYLAGRSRDLIISKGQNIYPAEIENAIAAHDAVHENSVVGLPDPEWGEVVCAAVVVKDGHHLEAADLVTFVQGRLASYKKPRHVVMVDELPRGQGGKVQKAEVASLVAAALGRDGV
jgi:fatty-acyl-CoA synthase